MPQIQRPSWPVIAALMIFLVILGGFIPAIFAGSQGTDTETFTQEEGETVVLEPPLEATVITVDQNPPQANVTLIDTQTKAENTTGILAEGDTTTVIIEGEEVLVKYDEAVSNNVGIFSYEYPVFYSWDNTTRAFVGIIGVIILLIFLYMIFIMVEPEEGS